MSTDLFRLDDATLVGWFRSSPLAAWQAILFAKGADATPELVQEQLDQLLQAEGLASAETRVLRGMSLPDANAAFGPTGPDWSLTREELKVLVTYWLKEYRRIAGCVWWAPEQPNPENEQRMAHVDARYSALAVYLDQSELDWIEVQMDRKDWVAYRRALDTFERRLDQLAVMGILKPSHRELANGKVVPCKPKKKPTATIAAKTKQRPGRRKKKNLKATNGTLQSSLPVPRSLPVPIHRP